MLVEGKNMIIKVDRFEFMIIIWSNFILEALEDQLSLFVFVLSDSVFCFEFVVFHRLGIVQVYILWMEHVGTQIQNSSFVDFGRLILRCVDKGVVLYKVADSLNKIAIFLLSLEVLLLRQVGQANQ